MLILLILITLGLLLKWSNYRSTKRLSKEVKNHIELFIADAQIYKVDLKTVEIDHRSWKIEILVDDYGNEVSQEIYSGGRSVSYKTINTYESKLALPLRINDEEKSFITTLDIDGDWLGTKFFLQKETFLFIDRESLDFGYLDLRFLNKEWLDYKYMAMAEKIIEDF